jgi:anti-sigma factor (TIGR02949 family)
MTPSEFENKDIKCEWVLDKIDAFLDGDLTEDEASRTRAHLKQCSACSSELELAAVTRSAIRDLPAQHCPDAVTAAVMERIANEPVSKRPALHWWNTLLGWRPLRPVAVAAALVLVVSMSVFIGQKQESPAPQFVNGNDTLEFSPEEVALAEAELKWTIAYISNVGRRAGLRVRDKAIYPHVVVPVKQALRGSLDGNKQDQP